MLGRAGEIKAMLVLEIAGTKFDETLNKALFDLEGSDEIININFNATSDSDGVAWFSALIVYKEAGLEC